MIAVTTESFGRAAGSEPNSKLTQLTFRQLNVYSFCHIVSKVEVVYKERTSSAQRREKVTGPSHSAVLDLICYFFTYLVKIRHFFHSVSEFIVTVFFLPTNHKQNL